MLSARAVDKDIVGNDNVGELTRCEGELNRDGCWEAAAARREAVAVCVSLFTRGDVEKNWASLLGRAADGLRVISGFSLWYEDGCWPGAGELPPNGLKDLRGIAILGVLCLVVTVCCWQNPLFICRLRGWEFNGVRYSSRSRLIGGGEGRR